MFGGAGRFRIRSLSAFSTNFQDKMDTRDIVVTLADKEMAFRLHFTGSEMPFLYYGGKKSDTVDSDCIQVDPHRVWNYSSENSCSTSYAEFFCLLTEAGNRLLLEDRMLFHGVGLIYKGRGYILTAPSGTGKSTQFMNLRMLYGEDCRIINGDKPVIRRMSDSEYRIYPSPWNGKENWAGKESAELSAIIWLEQGSENNIKNEAVSEMVLPILSQVIYNVPDTKTAHEACRMVDGVLSNVPVYRFTNTGSIESSKILGEFLDREAEK